MDESAYPLVHEGPPELDVTVVLPVYNEVGHLEEEIRRTRKALEASDYTFEIIVIDDGSTDGSTDLLRSVDGIRLFSFAENRGSGSARKYGTLAAKGRYVVWTDADMTYPNDKIFHKTEVKVGERVAFPMAAIAEDNEIEMDDRNLLVRKRPSLPTQPIVAAMVKN